MAHSISAAWYVDERIGHMQRVEVDASSSRLSPQFYPADGQNRQSNRGRESAATGAAGAVGRDTSAANCVGRAAESESAATKAKMAEAQKSHGPRREGMGGWVARSETTRFD
jgi:hypothetical protein